MPHGTTARKNEDASISWEECPIWPPDVFAVSATLINLSGCYSRSENSVSGFSQYRFTEQYRQFVCKLGADWRESTSGDTPNDLKDLWKQLLINGQCDVTDNTCHDIAFKLMAIADEASLGLGFNTSKKSFPIFFRVEHQKLLLSAKTGTSYQPGELYIPESICMLAIPDEVCVQPKTMTPQVGCTLRSFSHNLALLPSKNTVVTNWLFASDKQDEDDDIPEDKPFNLLLIPFPFHISGMAFKPTLKILET